MKIINFKIEDLKPYENNPRNNDDAVKYVKNSIEKFGFKVPIVVTKDGVIVTGHTRYKACLELGFKEIPCVIADDLSEEEIKAFRVVDNKVGEISFWDNDLLADEIRDLDIDMTDFGFGDFELNILLGDFKPESYDDDLIDEYERNEGELLKKKRVIINYETDEEEEFLKSLFKTDNLKVLYKVEELIEYANNSN